MEQTRAGGTTAKDSIVGRQRDFSSGLVGASRRFSHAMLASAGIRAGTVGRLVRKGIRERLSFRGGRRPQRMGFRSVDRVDSLFCLNSVSAHG